MDENTKDCALLNNESASVSAVLKAYRFVYLKNRKEYPLPFYKYRVVFIDGNKSNLRSWNLELLAPNECLVDSDNFEEYRFNVKKAIFGYADNL